MGLFDVIGGAWNQVSRAGNAASNLFGGGVKVNPDEYDMWGNKKAPQAPTYTAPQGPSLYNPTGFTGSAVTVGGIPGYTPTPTTTARGVVGTGYATPGTTIQNAPQIQLRAAVEAGANSDAIKATYGGGTQGRAPAVAPVNPPVTTPKVANPIQLPAPKASGTNYDAERLALARKRDADLTAYIDTIKNRANPYDVNGTAFKSALQTAINQANRSMSGAEERAQGALAERGMMGSGYEAAALGGLAAQRGALVSDTQGRMYGNAYRDGADFEMTRDSAILQALGGSSLDSVLGNLSTNDYNRNRDAVGDQRLDDAQRDQLLALVAKGAIELTPFLAKLLKIGG